MKTANYVLSKDVEIANYDNWDKRILPAGMFVKPIDPRYVPKHILDNALNQFFNPKTEVFVYCRIGIVVVDIDAIREV